MIPIIIPTYQPDEHLLDLLKNLNACNIGPVIIVNDGSEKEYDNILRTAKSIVEENNGKLLEHEANKGKGRALKTAFQYVIDGLPQAIGVVTADSDGQHTVNNIISVLNSLLENQDDLILGVRKFDTEGIPWKSRMGNRLTKRIFSYITGVYVSDTQTGLRGIPRKLIEDGLKINGEQFDYEMKMLLEAIGKCSVIEVPIDTIYDSKEKHRTHFNPIVDSIRIYKILLQPFFKFVLSSCSSFLIDLTIFMILCFLLRERQPLFYVTIATAVARVVSAIYNYVINYKVVFLSKESFVHSSLRYAFLAFVQMSLSAILITVLVRGIHMIPVVVLKIMVDVLLFFASYYVQKIFVF